MAKVLASSFRPAAVYLDLELPSDLARLEEPELYLTLLHDRQVIIDEIQRMPSLFPLLWALVEIDIEVFPVKDLQYLMERHGTTLTNSFLLCTLGVLKMA